MQFIDYLNMLFRWFHIFWGIMWIGLLYFYNFVNGPFTATMDAETKKKVIPELIPRSLWWFRFGAMWTWILGIGLIYIVYESGKIYLANPSEGGAGSVFLFYSFLLAPFIYDFLANSALAKNPKVLAGVGFVLICLVIWLLQNCCGFSYRGYVMYTGAMFGSIMAYNVWFRIWPNQKIILNGVKTGVPADAKIVAQTGTRSKHNTYLSLPLFWAMINAHTVALDSPNAWLIMCGVVAFGWFVIMQMYSRAAKIKGI